MASHRLHASKARARLDAIVSLIFAHAPDARTAFADCLALVPDDVRARYHAERQAVEDAEHAAISAGRAFRASHGLLIWK